MTALEAKVQEVCRRVLGGDAVVYIDAEAALEAVLDRMDNEAIEPGNNEADSLTKLRQSVEECASDLSSIRFRIDEMARAKR